MRGIKPPESECLNCLYPKKSCSDDGNYIPYNGTGICFVHAQLIVSQENKQRIRTKNKNNA